MNKQQETIISQAADNYANSIAQSDERKKYCACDFMAGANWALSHQWISVEEKLPKLNDKGISEEVFVRTSFGVFSIDRYFGMCKEWEYGHRNITHWMPIPTLTIIEDAEFENQQQ